MNAAFSRLTGYPDRPAAGHELRRHHPSRRPRAQRRRDSSSCCAAGETISFDKRYLHAAGHTVWVSVHTRLVRDDDGRPRAPHHHDRGHHRAPALRAQLQHMADHDPLTGLLNRRALRAELDRARRAVAALRRRAARVLVLDLDHFKYVNDTPRPPRRRRADRRASPTLLRARLRETRRRSRASAATSSPCCCRTADRDRGRARRPTTLLEARPRRAPPPAGRGRAGRSRRASASRSFDGRRRPHRRGAAGQRRPRDVRRQGGRARPLRVLRRRRARARRGSRRAWTWVERIRARARGRRLRAATPSRSSTSATRRGRPSTSCWCACVDDDGDLIPPGAFLPIAERFGLISEIDRWVVTQRDRAARPSTARPAAAAARDQPLRARRSATPSSPRTDRARAARDGDRPDAA